MNLKSYKELIVWQKSMNVVESIYTLTSGFPKNEMFGLSSQMRRAAISVPSNIAEGYGRKSINEYRHFYTYSYASALELETQLEIARRLGFIDTSDYNEKCDLLIEVIKMLYVMINGRRGKAE